MVCTRVYMKTLFCAILSFAFILLLIFGGDFLTWIKLSFLPSSLTGEAEYQALITENVALKAELKMFSALQNEVLHFKPDTIHALVYGFNPFDTVNFLAITAGKNAGVEAKMPVLANGLFVGEIAKTAPDQSIVRTIFDHTFEMPVKIGARAKGLLKGGVQLQITLIAAEEKVAPGDPVYAASRDFPLGLPLGTLGGVTENAGEAWRSAPLKVPYELTAISAVEVIKNFKP